MSDARRLEALKNTPHLVKQHGGCCGFAATLMALLIHAPDEVDALYETVDRGQGYRGIEKSPQVKGRVQKRIEGGFLNTQAANHLDAKLSIGLMILLKEYLRETGKDDIWEGCASYSELFSGWKYGDKLKELDDISTGRTEYPFSYKNGDLALTVYALRWLLSMVGFGMVDGDSLISNEVVASKKHALQQLTANAELTKGLENLVAWVDKGVYVGGVIGLAKYDFIGQDDQEPYEYISHWVYLPQQSQRRLDVWDTEVWTWGQVWTLRNLLLTHPRQYVPKVAVVFKAPGSGAPFV
jgi:hypothetical protein